MTNEQMPKDRDWWFPGKYFAASLRQSVNAIGGMYRYPPSFTVVQMVRDFRQFLVDLPGLMWEALCSLGTVLLVLAVWALLIALCLGMLYGLLELFLSPPTPPRVLTTSDLWWVVGFAVFIGAMAGEKK